MVAQTAVLQGLARSERQFDLAAAGIAHQAVGTPAPVDSVDLSAAAIALLEARNGFEAMTRVVSAGDRMERALIDTIG